jgi:hypothetical protein
MEPGAHGAAPVRFCGECQGLLTNKMIAENDPARQNPLAAAPETIVCVVTRPQLQAAVEWMASFFSPPPKVRHACGSHPSIGVVNPPGRLND